MQKAIKITESNAAAIEAALKEVNGKAYSHTYNTATEIFALAQSSEKSLEKMGIAKARRSGAIVWSVSGEAVANSYKGTRLGTQIRLERRSSDWYLMEVTTARLWKEGGFTDLVLTKAQDEEAVANFRKQYVMKA